jgi:hypothetical protein
MWTFIDTSQQAWALRPWLNDSAGPEQDLLTNSCEILHLRHETLARIIELLFSE